LRTEGPAAEQARREFAEILERKGHSVDNARDAVIRLERAFEEGSVTRTPEIDEVLADLEVSLEQDEGQKLGGKSAEASRFILRAIDRELDRA